MISLTPLWLLSSVHDDVIKWRIFPRYWPYVRGIHRSPMNSPRKGQWRGALVFSLICAWINARANNREAGDLRRHHAHYGVIVTIYVLGAIWGCLNIKMLPCQYRNSQYKDKIFMMKISIPRKTVFILRRAQVGRYRRNCCLGFMSFHVKYWKLLCYIRLLL